MINDLDFVIHADTARGMSRKYLENMETEEAVIFKNIMEGISRNASDGNFSLVMSDDVFDTVKNSGRARETINRALRHLGYEVKGVHPHNYIRQFFIYW